jgi:hypothetical protein
MIHKKGGLKQAINTTPEFPHGFVECRTCGARYCALKVYEITHRDPFVFRCDCGPQGLYLRWKVETSQHPAAVLSRGERWRQGIRKFFGGS